MIITTGNIHYALEHKEDLAELLNEVEFKFLENVGLTQAGAYGDIRKHLCLLEFVANDFERINLLRAENPNLLLEFNTLIDKLVATKERINKNNGIYFKDKD